MKDEPSHSEQLQQTGSHESRKYNLLIVASALHIGGTEAVIQNLSQYLDRRLFNVSVCHLKDRGDIGDDMYRAGMDIVGIPKSKILKVDYFTFLKLLKVIRSKKTDIVHSHTPNGLTDSALCKLLIPRLRLVHTFHFGNYPHEQKRRMLLERVFGRVADQLVAVGDCQKQAIEAVYGLGPTAMMKIWNGVTVSKDVEDFDLRPTIGPDNRIVIGTICTLYEQKGVTFLLDVAARLKNQGEKVAFVVAGEGPLRKELEKKILLLGLTDTVYLIGWVKDAAARLLPRFDIFFQPSLWEAMSVVILEAMEAGKPIVATRVGENPKVIEHDRDGLLVDPRDVAQMAAALQRLLHEPPTRVRLGLEANKKFKRTFTADRMTRDYEQLYLNVLRAKRRGWPPRASSILRTDD
jgi:glycosyltransferase involved in cell wall biosynthesis